MSTKMTLLSSPQMLGRPSSPLNPHTLSSSSPLTSPSPIYITPKSHTLHPFSVASSSSSKQRSTRYTRPVEAKRTSSYPTGPLDLFSEGTTPMEGTMWRERFTRRIEERERRKRVREIDLARRRSLPESTHRIDGMNEEEADRRAQADDEEIFRRLMVLQRSRARHAQLVSHELETGGSDADLPDFWEDEDELDPIRLEDRAMHSEDVSMLNVIRTALGRSGTGHREFGEEDEEDRWAREAAEAEEAEWKAEELEIVRRVEKAYGMGTSTARDGGDQDVRMGVDWEAFDAMDIE